MTKQLNQTTAVSASSALLNERTDKEILNLLKQARPVGDAGNAYQTDI